VCENSSSPGNEMAAAKNNDKFFDLPVLPRPHTFSSFCLINCSSTLQWRRFRRLRRSARVAQRSRPRSKRPSRRLPHFSRASSPRRWATRRRSRRRRLQPLHPARPRRRPRRSSASRTGPLRRRHFSPSSPSSRCNISPPPRAPPAASATEGSSVVIVVSDDGVFVLS
jgi:hypothetical protein